MNQAELAHLVAGLRIKLGPPKRLPVQSEGYRGSLNKLRTFVTALVANERIELEPHWGHPTRQYTELLLSDAVVNGDRHKHTMEMAKWWLREDQAAIHKLFKVLAPRYQDYTTSYTRLFHAPLLNYQTFGRYKPDKVLVELKGHPFPPLYYSNTTPNRNHIHNVLLAEAKKDRRLRPPPPTTSNENDSEVD